MGFIQYITIAHRHSRIWPGSSSWIQTAHYSSSQKPSNIPRRPSWAIPKPSFGHFPSKAAEEPLTTPDMDPRLTGGPPGLAQDGPLEDRLRNMIIGNNPQGAPQPGSQIGGHEHEAGASGHHAHTDAKASRGKRPNQAQRRQMNAQLSIPIDTRPTDQWSYQQQGQGHQGGTRPSRGNRGDFHHANSGRQHQQYAPQGSMQHGHQGHQGHQQGRGQGHYNQLFSHVNQGHHANQGQHGHFGGRGGQGAYRGRGRGGQYNNQEPRQLTRPEDFGAQVNLLDELCNTLLVDAEIERADIAEKEAFRIKIEGICKQVITEHEARDHGRQDFVTESVALKCFGSLASGFATKASDMDLGLVSPLSEPQPYDADSKVPRLVEKAFLEHGFGARLLTNARVPIIKVCEKPPTPLMDALQATRTKWENGIVDSPEAADHLESPVIADPPQSPEADTAESPEAAEVPQSPKAGDHSAPPRGRATGSLDKTSPQLKIGYKPPRSTSRQRRNAKRFLGMHQRRNESLGQYHAEAKSMLQSLGGSDLTVSKYREFELQDFEVLLGVCRAFVNGLYDKELKKDLMSYPSINPPTDDTGSQSQYPAWRTLHSVFTTAQTAVYLRAYSESLAQLATPDQNKHAFIAVAEWLDLQRRPDFGLDPLLYQKQLQIVHDKISQLPSIQFHMLEQQRSEPPARYYQRAVHLIAGLQPKNSVSSDEFSQYLVGRYAAGIASDELRRQLLDFIKDSPIPLTIVDVGRRHKSLRLAKEFEKALKADEYNPSLKEDIEEYISILRQPLVKLPTQPHHVVPQPNPRLLAVISQLQNPAKLEANMASRPFNDSLEFPKSGVGVQCDINFSAHLALQNTTLLRCYARTDPRVRPLVLFIKHWAKRRGINNPYRGTLSSYGYVLMMIHYLVNVAQPFVCPNLQTLGPQLPAPIDETGRLIPQFGPDGNPIPLPVDENVSCRGRFVGFWRDEAAIQHLSASNQLNGNRDTIGHLLRGFFEYYAQNGPMSTYQNVSGFDWGREAISIRTPHGIVPKHRKGWTSAKTIIEVRGRASPDPGAPLPSPMFTVGSPTDAPAPAGSTKAGPVSTGGGGEIKEIRNRYLVAIEDPFEHDHNVARTVTHKGIVAIREEFRRAWSIIRTTTANDLSKSGIVERLLQDVEDLAEKPKDETHEFEELLADIHGLGESV
ncbi:hypothetical protein F5X68DRAFT_176451 [Plectosphaerella plurivora]|uniref:polynucleotide adenylyltransferase n=1 Tax=Plectosphaerella plurivora TaxID=936078 RepID=A0A9P9A4B7_9PEZI|nr:hypothetical protein F5X68DRAFT_176451 [Plectosphaerella plurivora]